MKLVAANANRPSKASNAVISSAGSAAGWEPESPKLRSYPKVNTSDRIAALSR